MLLKNFKNYRLFINLIISPIIVFNPFGGGFPIGLGGWGVYIWPILVVLLLSYVLIYNYCYNFFWSYIEEYLEKILNFIDLIFSGYLYKPHNTYIYHENFILLFENICFHYFLYFLYIM
uniref:Ymf72 n=1 Tax=Tetrahymena paravorax TaxID=5905 RepID=Q09F55_TETPR|nr:Ymf72 [Tetrahymena paravorax]ABI51696.1 Ymf72 [Tetrahymena paravorax]